MHERMHSQMMESPSRRVLRFTKSLAERRTWVHNIYFRRLTRIYAFLCTIKQTNSICCFACYYTTPVAVPPKANCTVLFQDSSFKEVTNLQLRSRLLQSSTYHIKPCPYPRMSLSWNSDISFIGILLSTSLSIVQTSAATMSTVNLVKYYFYKGMMPKDPELLRNMVSLVYQTARDRKLYPKAILIRYVKSQDYRQILCQWM